MYAEKFSIFNMYCLNSLYLFLGVFWKEQGLVLFFFFSNFVSSISYWWAHFGQEGAGKHTCRLLHYVGGSLN